MSSPWGKFLAPITVPAGWEIGWNIGAGLDTAALTAGTYATILELLDHLKTIMDAASGTWTWAVSSTGTVSVSEAGGAPALVWASTTDALEELLGFNGTETHSGGTITALSRHTYGWYPGVISRGAVDGEGLAADTGWRPADQLGVTYSGSGAARRIAPARRAYRRQLRFGCLRRIEVFDRSRGVAPLWDRWATSSIRWYPDRDDGTVAAPGTQMDPGYPDFSDGTAGQWWLVTLASEPRVTPLQHPDWLAVEIELSAEPA